jgi:predicted lipoprotein with Yx(FWY)xxD motif
MHRATRTTSLLAVAGVAAILAGCAAQGGGGTPAASTPAASTPVAAGSPGVYSVDLHQDASLGSFLVGEDGKTLYLLTKDPNGASTCTGNCATTWPPFTLDADETAVAGAGVTGTIGTIKRPDGSTQVAINGVPLYYFAGDSAAGDTEGEGSNNVWFVVGADGTAVQAPAPSATDGGYSY